jgi:hypothetical protein
VAERGSTGRTRSDTIEPMKRVATQDAYDSFTLLEIGEEGDDDEMELSDCNWEGWMRDLDRQGRVERSRTAQEAHRGGAPQTTSSLAMPSPAAPSNRSSAESPASSLSVLKLSSATEPSSAPDP